MPRLLLCYVPALDVRRIEAGAFPTVARLMRACPTVRFRPLPVSENLATTLTGAPPHVHGMWGPRLLAGRRRSVLQYSVDLLPDLAATTAQCIAHVARGPIELATMPPRRRRRFDWRRINIKFARDRDTIVRRIPNVPSLFNLLGDQSRFVYEDRFDRLGALLDVVANGDLTFQMIDNHSLDYLLHWNTGSPAVADYEAGTDRFIAELEAKCRRNGIHLVLLSDHGQEAVTRVVDLAAEIEAAGLGPDQIDRFIENTRAALWWHDDAARALLMDRLDRLDGVAVLLREDLARFGIHFADRSYGDAYAYADPGCTFFPNDFFQPIANHVLALKDRGMRTRRARPWHVGDHGYLADTDAEIGFMTLAADGYVASPDPIDITDIAPSIMALLGHRPPASMTGRAVFARWAGAHARHAACTRGMAAPRRGRRMVRYAVAIALLAALILAVPADALRATLSRAHPAGIATALVMALASHLLIAQRIRYLTAALGLPLPFWALLRINLGAVFYGLALPAGNLSGVAARLYQMARAGGHYAEPAVALTLERLVATVTLGAIGVLCWPVTGPADTWPVFVLMLAATLGFAALQLAMFRPLTPDHPGLALAGGALARQARLRCATPWSAPAACPGGSGATPSRSASRSI